jgi:hypothetical protein
MNINIVSFSLVVDISHYMDGLVGINKIGLTELKKVKTSDAKLSENSAFLEMDDIIKI